MSKNVKIKIRKFTCVIPFVGWIITIVISVLQANGLSKAFGKSTGFTVGLVLIPSIFYLILGLGSSTYIGSNKETDSSNNTEE